jgi:hypothetical protein
MLLFLPGHRVSLQNDVDDVFQMDVSVFVCGCFCVPEDKFGKIKDTITHLEILAQEHGRSILLLLEITLGHLSSIVRQLNLDAIHYEFHGLDCDIAIFDLLYLLQVLSSAHHFDSSLVQARILLVVWF